VSDIVEFLRARLDEDERIARAAACDDEGNSDLTWSGWHLGGQLEEAGWSYPEGVVREAHILRHAPASILREVAAKRRFIEQHAPPDPHEPGKCPDCDMLYAFAAIHAEHPDYRQEWAL
jgi:hypothetical protein